VTAALAFDSLGLRRAIVEWYAPDTARGVDQTFSLLDVAQDNAHDLLLLQLACRARGLACSSDTPPAGRLCCRGAVLPMRLMPTTRARPAETPDQHGAYPRLDDEQIEALSALGERRAAKEGEVLFREGDDPYDFYLVLAGLVAITQGTPPDEQLIAVHGPRRFLGELGLLTGQPAFFTATMLEDGGVLRVPVEEVREQVAQDPPFGDLILRAFLQRREILLGLAAGVKVIGSCYAMDTRRLLEFLARNRIPHRWIQLEEDPQAEALLRELGVTPEDTPVVISTGGQVLRNPSNRELAEALHLSDPRPERDVYDLVIVGAGPAGLAASVYAASEGLETVTLEGVATGGQAGTSMRIENYLGFPSGITGAGLAERARIQAEKFGARITVPTEAVALRAENGHHVVALDDGTELTALTVLIATGARYRKLPVEGLERFEGTSVFYAATPIEARVCAGDPVAIVGGGNSAGQAALFLSRHASLVRLIIREDSLDTYMSRYLADRIERTSNIEVLPSTEVREPVGDEALEALIVEHNRTGERREVPAWALFVFIGARPHTGWLGDQIALDDRGFVATGKEAGSARGGECPALFLETSRPGVLAAGDVRAGSVKRVASAVGEGSMAVQLVHAYLSAHRGSREAALTTAPAGSQPDRTLARAARGPAAGT